MAEARKADPAAEDADPLLAQGLDAMGCHVRKVHTVTSMSTAHPLEAVHYLDPLPDAVAKDHVRIGDNAHERDDGLA